MLKSYANKITKQVKKKKNSLFLVCSILFFCFGYVSTMVSFWLDGKNHLDSDISSEMVLAHTMNKYGDCVLSRHWNYSTELRVLYPQLVFRVALEIFSDWHVARTVSVAVLLLILAASTVFFCRTLNCSWSVCLWVSGILMYPFGADYEYIVILGSSYISYIIVTFLSYALFVEMLRMRQKKRRSLSIILLVLSFLLAFVSGLSGIRQVIVSYLPLFCASVIFCILEGNRQDEKGNDLSRVGMCFSFLLLAACGTGFLFNNKVLSGIYSFRSYDNNSLRSFSLSDFLNYAGEWVDILGYKGAVNISDGQGQAALSAMLLCLVVLFILMIGLFRRSTLSSYGRFTCTLAASSFFIQVIVYFLGNQPLARFLVPAVVVMFPCIACILTDCFQEQRCFKLLLFWIIGCCIIFQSYKNYYSPAIHNHPSGDDVILADWLMDQGYRQGVAKFWTRNKFFELTSGKVEMWTVSKTPLENDTYIVEPLQWLQEKEHSEKLPDSDVVFIRDTEDEWEFSAVEKDMTLIHQQGRYLVYQVIDNHAFWDTVYED